MKHIALSRRLWIFRKRAGRDQAIRYETAMSANSEPSPCDPMSMAAPKAKARPTKARIMSREIVLEFAFSIVVRPASLVPLVRSAAA
jgi:hypothetical protein